jgi:hypothetical protein
MNSARKDGRSFWKARTFTEETEAIRTATRSSTRYKNKWAVEVFKEWQYYRATKGETSSEVDEVQEMNGESMEYWLGKFVQEVVRRDGQKYSPRSLYGIVENLVWSGILTEKNGSLALNPLDKLDRRWVASRLMWLHVVW